MAHEERADDSRNSRRQIPIIDLLPRPVNALFFRIPGGVKRGPEVSDWPR